MRLRSLAKHFLCQSPASSINDIICFQSRNDVLHLYIRPAGSVSNLKLVQSSEVGLWRLLLQTVGCLAISHGLPVVQWVVAAFM